MMTYIPLKEIALVIFSLFLYMVLLAILVIPIESLFGISPTFSAAILGVAWQISVLLFLFKYSIKKNLSYNFFGFSLPNSWKYYFIATNHLWKAGPPDGWDIKVKDGAADHHQSPGGHSPE